MSQETVIAGRAYTATKLPAMRALKLLARLGRVAGPSAALLTDGDANIDAAARALFDRLGEDELELLVRGLLESVRVEGRPVLTGFDTEYAGKLDEVFQLVKFALEVQFGGFFAALSAAIKGSPAAASKSS